MVIKKRILRVRDSEGNLVPILAIKGDKGDAGSGGGGSATDVKINGTSITVNGVANIPKATTSALGVIKALLSELTGDSTHRVVTDTEKATWSAKQDALTFDDLPTQNSNNVPKSGGVYSFVNSSVSTATAYFIGTFNSVDALNAYAGTKTINDYAFVKGTDSAGNAQYNRYKWDGSQWLFEYTLNNSSFTANQWATINSGLTANSLTGKENTSNKVTAISADSTDTQYPSAKAVYTLIGDIESALSALR